MFEDLDTTLGNVLSDATAPTQLRSAGVSFETPDKSYKPHTPDSAINLFLYEVKENRELRDPEPITQPAGFGFIKRQPPLRVACSYLVTAWKDGLIGASKIRAEHQLLGQAFFWLSRFPVIPDTFFAGSMIGQPFPPPTMVAQWDVANNQGEFWTSLGIPPRPYFNLIVTIAMDLNQSSVDYPVTSSITSYRQNGDANAAETIIQIGGSVVGGTPLTPVDGAWVRLQDGAGNSLQTTTTDPDGHFTFTGLTAGNYQLRVRAHGFAEPVPPIAITVPSPTGNFDVQLT